MGIRAIRGITYPDMYAIVHKAQACVWIAHLSSAAATHPRLRRESAPEKLRLPSRRCGRCGTRRSRIEAEADGAYQVFKLWIGADGIEDGFDLEEDQPSAAFFYSVAQQFERRIFLSQTYID